MCLMEKEHAETGLSDTATDGLRELSIQQSLMPVEILSLFRITDLKLLKKGGSVYSDTHAGKLKVLPSYLIPDDDISVKAMVAIDSWSRPVVIVWSTARVRRISITDSNKENSTLFLCQLIFPFLRTLIRPHGLRLFCVNEGDFFRKIVIKLRIEL